MISAEGFHGIVKGSDLASLDAAAVEEASRFFDIEFVSEDVWIEVSTSEIQVDFRGVIMSRVYEGDVILSVEGIKKVRGAGL